MLSCIDVTDMVTDYLEAELDAGLRVQFEQHVVVCPPCRAHLSQMRQTRTALRCVPEEPLSPELELALLGAFRAWRDAP